MTASVEGVASASGISSPVRKKRVLLVDTCRAQRDMRGETMRRLGMEVDCAADISEARSWWRPDLYDLVLFHVQSELPHMYKFWDDIRAATPSQRTAFLVGKPGYLAASPNDQGPSDEVKSITPPSPGPTASLSMHTSFGVPKHWGILEACRRISAVRSLADARSRALRDKPLPVRDSATAEPKLMVAELQIDAELLREDMQ